MTDKSLSCDIYRCNNKDGMYLYVEHASDLNNIPDLLKKKTGKIKETRVIKRLEGIKRI